MSTTLGGTAIPTPVAYPHTGDDTMVQRRMANGALRTAIIAQDRKWTLSWTAISSGNLTTLRGRYTTTTAQTFVDEDSNSYSVHITPNTWTCTPTMLAAGRRYNVSFGITEV